ncbi:2-oxoadipate dehydrogenase complex component E1-like [Amphiura filiformis]|uniref:2-oxoadipate dehydrogenase complex component E1-like n=1 Tax=Amphiura filiformis TaxID=82378 RepID=UPI003B21C328
MLSCVLKQVVRQRPCRHLPAMPAVAFYHSDNGVYGYRPAAWTEQTSGARAVTENRICYPSLMQLVTAYREHGHKKAKIDPLGRQKPRPTPELDPAMYGISLTDNKVFELEGIVNSTMKSGNMEDIVSHLESLYCDQMSAEFMHLTTMEEREWFAEKFEESRTWTLSDDEKKSLALTLAESQAFDNFLAAKFGTIKRYSGEGAESMMGFFQEVFKQAVQDNLEEVHIGMPHRARLNLLTGLLKYPATLMFKKMKGLPEFPQGAVCSGDVLSHLYNSVDLDVNGRQLHVSMIPNPSHLEACTSVLSGKVRGRQQSLKDGDYCTDVSARVGDKVLGVQVHGDASFTAQGIIQENFAIAEVPHFNIGGTLHLIVNNQLGFTTPGERGRSSLYCSDIGKMNGNPVIHVNGDNPEEVVRACRLAMEYRQHFRKDVLVDLQCWRKWGHNEIDDPSFTNPSMYSIINNRTSVPDLYVQKLTDDGLTIKEEVNDKVTTLQVDWNEGLKTMDTYQAYHYHLRRRWKGFVQAPSHVTAWETGVQSDLLRYIGAKSVEIPSDFVPHPHLKKTFLQSRLRKLEEGKPLDWATAEAMAFGSLLYEGFNVRICGQDVGRGTFSQRHAMLIDNQTDAMYIPLNNIMPQQTGFYEVANSPLSEEAVLGFEYGMSIENPNNLIIWEAQFGDFYNGAQIIIDTFVTSGEVKWLLQSGLVMLLPHGYDGAGPEHSSCHIERFLQLCDSKEHDIDGDDVNTQIVHPTTPAQYFHLLRRQMVRNYRKPLIVAGPKVMLRLPAAVSNLADMGPGTSFQPVIPDSAVDPNRVDRVVFCCGKHYYALAKEREDKQLFNTALIRVEELCPFPTALLQEQLNKYPNAKAYVWSQEEHTNMGPWFFVNPRFNNLVGCKLSYVGRGPLGTAAAGVGQVHQQEAKQVIQQTFQG